MPQVFVVSQGPPLTLCISPPSITAVYASIVWFNENGEEFSGLTVRLDINRPCVTLNPPAGADHGLVMDLAGIVEDKVIPLP